MTGRERLQRKRNLPEATWVKRTICVWSSTVETEANFNGNKLRQKDRVSGQVSGVLVRVRCNERYVRGEGGDIEIFRVVLIERYGRAALEDRSSYLCGGSLQIGENASYFSL